MKTVQEQDIGNEQEQQTVPQEDIDKLYTHYEEREQLKKTMENEQKNDLLNDKPMSQ